MQKTDWFEGHCLKENASSSYKYLPGEWCVMAKSTMPDRSTCRITGPYATHVLCFSFSHIFSFISGLRRQRRQFSCIYCSFIFKIALLSLRVNSFWLFKFPPKNWRKVPCSLASASSDGIVFGWINQMHQYLPRACSGCFMRSSSTNIFRETSGIIGKIYYLKYIVSSLGDHRHQGTFINHVGFLERRSQKSTLV